MAATSARIALEAYDRIVGLVLEEIAIDGCITKAPSGSRQAGHGTLQHDRRLRHPAGPHAGRGEPHKGDKAPIQAGQCWHVERTNAWHNAFNRLQR
jgi:hypothetical protein